MNPERTFAAALVLVFGLGAVARAQEAAGTVMSVAGKTVTIRIEAGGPPKPGDRVELSDEVPDVGRIALRGHWIVTAVDGARVTAEAGTSDAGAGQPGQRATIKAAHPRPDPGVSSQPAPAVKTPTPATLKEGGGASSKPPPAGWIRHTDQGGRISVDLPGDYAPLASSDPLLILLFGTPTTANHPPRVFRASARALDWTESLSDFRELHNQSLRGRFTGYKMLRQGEGVVIAGKPALWLEYAYVWQGQQVRVISYFFANESVGYEVGTVTLENEFERSKPEFQAILASIRLGAAGPGK